MKKGVDIGGEKGGKQMGTRKKDSGVAAKQDLSTHPGGKMEPGMTETAHKPKHGRPSKGGTVPAGADKYKGKP